MNNGIAILTAGRSGSSLIAGIFASHGVWCGDSRNLPQQYNAKGYYENDIIHKEMKKYFGRDITGPMPKSDDEWDARFVDLLEKQGVTDPWFIKSGAWYWPAFESNIDYVIKTKKPTEDIIQSYLACGFLGNDRSYILDVIEPQIEFLEELPGVFVEMDRFLDKDWSQLREAFEYCGLEFDQSIAEDFYEEDLHHI